ncbi:MAG: rRNA maturation RNase YbeY [Paludibacter sp.]
MIQYIAENIEIPYFDKQIINRWITDTAAEYKKKIGKVAYIFCNDERILEVNKQFLNHDYYTDIITFDYSDGRIISGDIFISIDTIKSNAKEFNESLDAELQRIMIHGILHLCGQDDKTVELRKEMTQKENRAIHNLNLYSL